MESVLITGASQSGVTGRYLKEQLRDEYNVLSPGSDILDLENYQDVRDYFLRNKIDFVIHCATHRVKSKPDRNTLKSNLRMFFNLNALSSLYQKMIVFGSGAEYDKKYDIIRVKEDELGTSIPFEDYGLSKYIINEYARKCDNVINLRLFGTCNYYERFQKNFISNICCKVALDIPPTIRQDCKFSFVDVDDLVAIIKWVFKNDTKYNEYNVCPKSNYYLSELVDILLKISGKQLPILIKREGLDLEYTGNGERLLREIGNGFEYSDMETTIKKIYEYFLNNIETLSYEEVKNNI